MTTANPEDLERILEIRHAAFAAHAPTAYSAAEVQTLLDDVDPSELATMISNRKLFVARKSGRVVGSAGWEGEYLRHVYVDPGETRQGIGSNLLQRAEEDFVARTGSDVIKAGVALHAESFYLANGYSVVERATAWDGSSYFEMTKSLEPTAPESKVDLHPLVARFGEVVADYDARPDYPTSVIDLLQSHCGLVEDSVVADIGAGTGKLTRLLVGEPRTVIAVDPTMAMLDHLRLQLPSVDAREGSAERLPVEDASVDIVVAGNAFHWFDQSLVWAELDRVLKPTGSIAVMWASRDRTRGWQYKISDAIESHSAGSPAGNDDWSRWKPSSDCGFQLVAKVHEQYDLEFTRARLVRMFSSFSFIANLDSGGREAVLDEISHAAPVEDDDIVFPMTFDLDFYVVRRDV